MLCAFSGPIRSHAFSPMSPALPGGQSRSLTLFIQTEQLGPSQPKQRGMGREIIMETSGLTKRWKCLSVPFFYLLSSSPSFVFLPWVPSVAMLGCVQLRSSWTAGQTLLMCFLSCLLSLLKILLFISLSFFSFYSHCN